MSDSQDMLKEMADFFATTSQQELIAILEKHGVQYQILGEKSTDLPTMSFNKIDLSFVRLPNFSFSVEAADESYSETTYALAA